MPPTPLDAASLFDLTGKTAVITGTSSGLGVTFANALATNGANVVLAARRKDRLREYKRASPPAPGRSSRHATSPRPIRSRRCATLRWRNSVRSTSSPRMPAS